MGGNALDGSSGAPYFIPHYGTHHTWSFASHYFFETYNGTTGKVDAHAAYGDFYAVKTGETLITTFEAKPSKNGPVWTLTMAVLGDDSRTSKLVVDKPYMGIGVNWPEPVTSWTGTNYTNLCINACWELYGANDLDHFPSSGAEYKITISREENWFDWVTKWDEDESRTCPGNAVSNITEKHDEIAQQISWSIIV